MIQKDLFKLSETDIKIKVNNLDDNEASLDKIWNNLDYNFGSTLPFIEQTMNRWNERNQIMNTNLKQKGALNKSILD